MQTRRSSSTSETPPHVADLDDSYFYCDEVVPAEVAALKSREQAYASMRGF